MTQEALKLALDGITKVPTLTHGLMVKLVDVEAAIKEALAQPERDYERGFIDGMQKQMQSSVDKAVNRMAQTQERPVDCERCNRLEEQAYDLVGKLRVANIKLSMQPQRTWVGLEGEEIRNLWEEATKPDRSTMTIVTSFARAIEAKLKERNT